MTDEAMSFAILEQPTFTARDLRKVAGLSYRRLNEWDKRHTLPHERAGQAGWRKLNAWQAMALAVTVDLHRRFDIPMGKLRLLTEWMLGLVPLSLQHTRLKLAEWTFRERSLRSREVHRYYRHHPPPEAIAPGEKGMVSMVLYDRLQDRDSAAFSHADHTMTRKLEEISTSQGDVLPYLITNGWDPDQAEAFARRFFTLAVRMQ